MIRPTLILALCAGTAAAAAARLDDFRYRNRHAFSDRLAELDPCDRSLARAAGPLDRAEVDHAIERAEAYVDRWVVATDRETFARATDDEAVGLAKWLLTLSLDLRLDHESTLELDQAQLNVGGILAQRGFLAGDVELRKFERELRSTLNHLGRRDQPPTPDEIAEITFDVALLTGQEQLARRARGSDYRMSQSMFAALARLFDRKKELN